MNITLGWIGIAPHGMRKDVTSEGEFAQLNTA
jgi:hypothetical protein